MLALLALVGLTGPAHAASPWPLPDGAWSVYAGLGQSTFATGMSGFSRDRYVQSRASAWVGRGVSDRVHLELSAPFQITRVVEDPDEGPCPTDDDYCARTVGVGSVELAALIRVSEAGPVAVRLGVRGDPWNAPLRGRWTNPGQGTVGAVADVIGEVTSGEHPRWRLGGAAGAHVPWPQRATSASGETRWLPAPTVRGTVEGGLREGVLEVTLAVHGHARLWGETYGPDWVRDWRPVLDRWRVTRWAELRPELRVSVLTNTDWGVHVTASRSVLVVAGPPDLWDVGVGVHVYIPKDD